MATTRKSRHNYTPSEKVAILRRNLLEKAPVADLCEEYQLHPSAFYQWLKQFFEKGAAAFTPDKPQPGTKAADRKIADLEAKLTRKHEVLSELMEEHLALKKTLGEP